MSSAEAELGVRHFLDSWKFWVGIAYFAIVGVIVVLFFIQRDVSRQQADRAAEQKANAVAQRDNCYQSVDSSPDLIALLDTLAQDRHDRIKATRKTLRLEPDSPLTPIRTASIHKSQRALEGIHRFRVRIVAQTPSEKKCDALSLKLGLQPRDLSRQEAIHVRYRPGALRAPLSTVRRRRVPCLRPGERYRLEPDVGRGALRRDRRRHRRSRLRRHRRRVVRGGAEYRQ